MTRDGGAVRLALTVLLVYCALRGGLRATRRWQGRSTGRLALGGTFGLTAVTAGTPL